jgi:hypothetical protein
MGEPGPGGAYHDYEVRRASPVDEAPGESFLYGVIPFQCGPRKDPTSQSGLLDTDLLEIVRDRLAHFQQGEFSTRENSIALDHIEEALLWMNKHAEDRIERNALGTYEK